MIKHINKNYLLNSRIKMKTELKNKYNKMKKKMILNIMIKNKKK